ncbi:uncharacterized protein LOC132402176 [Hypanus sabinus]|uniref:uncharacterized protein LOC132402176 n=1 Tax=Hypanus sabinus TaxID=79690 RepID=UPI0028C37EA6|nr:uncharacterized protein LOC132402176 [Hypanus sabinus]XP_059840838.1 uncharacterized protein LOC132402176 [Hypanus sabinus]XP_059840839.1 uncharacterized protein LOC132402176 [Hypanus sabinus]XP_059840840.1 uncharacterized protein LOC132402176 [Hypanus sabinus]XP_059840841.1 uncharacterized protein LOC132402176 [Hypanus sabinus]XP_059840842.1 uncharacterized protein LOC132402176 [Hypanus sabinus]
MPHKRPGDAFYYWANNIRNLIYWKLDLDSPLCPQWVNLECNEVQGYSLFSILGSSLPTDLVKFNKQISNPVVKHTLRIWFQFRKFFTLKNFVLDSPILLNFFFKPSLTDQAFSIWKRKGIKCFRDLFFEGSLMSFDQLSNKFKLPKSNFFRYLQIRNFLHKVLPSFPNSTSMDFSGLIFTLNPCQKGLVAFIYNMIMKIQPEISGRIKQEWEKELQYNISTEKWEKILQMVNSSSICAKHALIQFKIVHRAHMSKDKLARFYSHINPQCDRCHLDVASLTHMFLHNYWKDIFATISSIWNIDLQPHFITAIFGIPNEDGNQFSPSIRRMIAFVTLMARRSILQIWKEVNPPTTFQWFSQTISYLSLEKIRSTIFDSSIKFEETCFDIFI